MTNDLMTNDCAADEKTFSYHCTVNESRKQGAIIEKVPPRYLRGTSDKPLMKR